MPAGKAIGSAARAAARNKTVRRIAAPAALAAARHVGPIVQARYAAWRDRRIDRDRAVKLARQIDGRYSEDTIIGGAPRPMVIAMIGEQQGGYEAIYRKNLKFIKDQLYAAAVEAFNESHKDDFGLVESIGDDWGMKGVFQSTLRIVLYGGDDDAA